MIAKQDLENIEKIKELLKPDDAKANTIDWNKVMLIDTLDRVVNNLRIAHVSYCPASDEDIANRYYTAECNVCGWWGSSKLLEGGGQIADTGDYGDCNCPVCGDNNVDEKEGL